MRLFLTILSLNPLFHIIAVNVGVVVVVVVVVVSQMNERELLASCLMVTSWPTSTHLCRCTYDSFVLYGKRAEG